MPNAMYLLNGEIKRLMVLGLSLARESAPCQCPTCRLGHTRLGFLGVSMGT